MEYLPQRVPKAFAKGMKTPRSGITPAGAFPCWIISRIRRGIQGHFVQTAAAGAAKNPVKKNPEGFNARGTLYPKYIIYSPLPPICAICYVPLHRFPEYSVYPISPCSARRPEILQELPPDLDSLVCHVFIVPSFICDLLRFRYHRITSLINIYQRRHVVKCHVAQKARCNFVSFAILTARCNVCYLESVKRKTRQADRPERKTPWNRDLKREKEQPLTGVCGGVCTTTSATHGALLCVTANTRLKRLAFKR